MNLQMASATTTGILVTKLPNAAPMQVGRKRLGHAFWTTSIADHLPSHLLFLTDTTQILTDAIQFMQHSTGFNTLSTRCSPAWYNNCAEL